jgi:hypothetical protein
LRYAQPQPIFGHTTLFMKKHLALLAICGLLMGSCKKTVSPTQAELNAAELKKAIGSTSPSDIEVWNTDNNSLIGEGTSISISGDGTASVFTGNSYISINLGLLKTWEVVSTASNSYELDLYY